MFCFGKQLPDQGLNQHPLHWKVSPKHWTIRKLVLKGFQCSWLMFTVLGITGLSAQPLLQKYKKKKKPHSSQVSNTITFGLHIYVAGWAERRWTSTKIRMPSWWSQPRIWFSWLWPCRIGVMEDHRLRIVCRSWSMNSAGFLPVLVELEKEACLDIALRHSILSRKDTQNRQSSESIQDH